VSKHQGSILVTTLLSIAGFSAVVIALCWVLSPNRFPIATISVDGGKGYVSATDVRSALADVEHSNFFTLNIAQAQQALMALQWVQWAEVKRSWPGKLEVRLVEQVPVARWNNKGLLNASGEPFVTGIDVGDYHHLPSLLGSAGDETHLWQKWMEVELLLGDSDVRIKEFRREVQGGYSALLDSGIELRLGRSQVLKRLERYLDVHERFVQQQKAEVAYVDLRYDNGVALGWKNEQ
jgi:cell division protein FtsQ|tara:strand:+ start:15855 stop:16562 length:708 start_codon:yes stop_codon:yes gene_type:complete